MYRHQVGTNHLEHQGHTAALRMQDSAQLNTQTSPACRGNPCNGGSNAQKAEAECCKQLEEKWLRETSLKLDTTRPQHDQRESGGPCLDQMRRQVSLFVGDGGDTQESR